MRIVYKGDLGLIPSFKDAGLGPFELYVRDSKDLDETLEDFCAIHFVHKIDDGRAIDLGDTGEVGDVSAELLKKAVECAKRNQVGKIVVHPPAINIWEQERKEVISSFAQKLEYAYDSDVEICIENLALWIHTAYTSEPLFYDPADFLDILEGTKVPIGVTMDVEHFYLSAVMEQLYEKHLDTYSKVNEGKLSREDMESILEKDLDSLCRGKDLGAVCDEYLSEAIETLGDHIKYIHVCGSDFNNYFFNPQNRFPLVGEHLPLGFEGEIFGNAVRDGAKHPTWIRKFQNRDIDVLVEVSKKDGYDLINQLKKSKESILEQFEGFELIW